jgi:hypothetical protein
MCHPAYNSWFHGANIHIAVPFASWTAFYDIRVDMDAKESPVTIIYKAAVNQDTGEVRNFVVVLVAEPLASPGTMSLYS